LLSAGLSREDHKALAAGRLPSVADQGLGFPRPNSHPHRGIKDSGLGHKEGVQEAMKSFCNGKTFTMPWG
jgi:acyl-CoA reductase-like NAD-dependent aldehyde dehydrogenase